MKCFAIKNHVTQSLFPAVPWEYQFPTPVSDDVRKDKEKRQAWYRSPATEHQFYTFSEPHNPNQRASKDNPVRLIHGFAVDYDLSQPTDYILAQIEKRMKIKPSWLEVSLGGNFRLVWLFEVPLKVHSNNYAVKLLSSAVDWLNLKTFPGFDEGAFCDPNRTLANGGVWTNLGNPPISEGALTLFAMEVTKDYTFEENRSDILIPLDKVEAAVREKYPNLSWPGEWSLEAQGPSFWIPGSQSPMSAIIKEHGMITFAAHADKAFYTWGEIVGKEFVEQYRGDTYAKIRSQFFSDAKGGYWFLNPLDNQFRLLKSVANLRNMLAVDYRISEKAQKGEPSPMNQVVSEIDKNRIDGVAPVLFKPRGMVEFDGRRVLNTSSVRAVQPAEGPQVWGPEGNFPTISDILDKLFSPREPQLDYFLAWHQRFYASAQQGALRQGHTLFLVGGTGIGKTLVNIHLIGASVGGSSDGGYSLANGGEFTSQLFEKAHIRIDDLLMGESPETQGRFAQGVKKYSANTRHTFHKKFEVPVDIDWRGRLVVTLNKDYPSMRTLGSIDSESMHDKICVFQCADKRDVPLPPSHILEPAIERELPFYLRWLFDWKIPAHITPDPRFGFVAYRNQEVIIQNTQTSNSAPIKELVVQAMETYFQDHKDAEVWQGTSTAMMRLLNANPFDAPSTRTFTPNSVSKHLELLLSDPDLKEVLSCHTGTRNLRFWTFKRI